VAGLVCGYGEQTILRDVTFNVARGEIFFIVGGSGCGKSTLLRHLVGLNPPTGGSVRFLGAPFSEADAGTRREQLRLVFTGSAMELIERFFPDPVKHHTFRALLAFAAIQSTYKGPYTPGSALCLVYTFAQSGDGGLMRRVKGGMGALSEALARSISADGG
jgi:ABC-type molybdenum transport system ATPase subunit/photorepair protein PhrA